MSAIFTLSVQCRLSASHVLPDSPPCDRLHGHTWTVKAHWAYTELDSRGMGANFHALKDALQKHVRARYDHRHLNDIPPFDDLPPTAENLARQIYRILASHFDAGHKGRLARVEVWEGPESCASYEETQDE